MPDMISIQKMRELVEHSEELSDEDLGEARDSIYGLLEIAFDVWRKKEISHKKYGQQKI